MRDSSVRSMQKKVLPPARWPSAAMGASCIVGVIKRLCVTRVGPPRFAPPLCQDALHHTLSGRRPSVVCSIRLKPVCGLKPVLKTVFSGFFHRALRSVTRNYGLIFSLGKLWCGRGPGAGGAVWPRPRRPVTKLPRRPVTKPSLY